MKKLILLSILTLGFIYEGKAQIAPSTEIYYYVDVKKILIAMFLGFVSLKHLVNVSVMKSMELGKSQTL